MTERPGTDGAPTGGAVVPGADVAGAETEPPPFFGSWPRLYALVIAELIAIILLCGWLAGLGR